MDPARAQGGADACAAIEAKKTVAGHGRIAIPESATQERTHEDRAMTGQGAAAPPTTPYGCESTAAVASPHREPGAGCDSAGRNDCSGRRAIPRQMPQNLKSAMAGFAFKPSAIAAERPGSPLHHAKDNTPGLRTLADLQTRPRPSAGRRRAVFNL